MKDTQPIAMRNCPHCGKEIQDEAAFCRFCRKDVEPPLWLTSLQKCPYCAEWVERGIERCPLCGKVLISEEPFYTSEEADSTEILLKEVRENIFSKNRDENDESEDDEEPLSQGEPPFHAVPRTERSYQEPSSDPLDSQEGLGVLRGRQREEIPLSRFDEPDSQKADKPKERPQRRIPFARIAPWFVLIIAVGAVVAVAIYAFQQFDPLGALGFGASPDEATATSPAPTQTAVDELQPTSTYVAATLPPLATTTGSPGECVLWDEITVEMEGQQMCAFGIIKRRFRVDSEIPYMAIFSEEEGTFAIVDRLNFYTQFRPGDCILASGEVEIMRGVRPFIDAGNALVSCPSEE